MYFLLFFGNILISHIECSSLSADEKFVIPHLVDSIFTFWEDKAISLSIHGFWSQGGANHVNVFIGELGINFFWMENLLFDQGVFLWVNTFPALSIVISAHLVVLGTENRGSLAKLDKSIFL